MKKRFITFPGLTLLLLAGCATQTPTMPGYLPDNWQEVPAITILHTNDAHGYYSSVDALSGVPAAAIGHDYIAAIYADVAANSDNPVFLLDAGDATQGIYFVGESEGEAAIRIMNAVGYDAMTLGNHEFDYGWFRLAYLIGLADFPVLCQLDDAEAGSIPNLHQYTIIERDGVRLGVFGLTTPETEFKSNGGFGRDFGSREQIIAQAKHMVQTLRVREKADYVICLAHLGVEDMGYGTSYDIRDNVAGIDLIIDGHSHTKLAEIVNVPGKTQITSTGAYGVVLGRADLRLTAKGATVDLGGYTKDDAAAYQPVPEVAAVITEWAAKVAAEGNAVVARIPFDVTTARANERTRETVLGDIITDAMRWASGARIAIENGGGIRDQQLQAGNVTKGQLITILPFGNVLQMAEVQGAVILAALEQSVSMYPEANGGFLQVSGLSYTFDPALPVGSRVTGALVGGQPLDPEEYYTVATNDFTAMGGDNYHMLIEPFSDQLPLARPELSALEAVLIQYLNSHQSQLSNSLEGRISVSQ